MPSLHLFPTFDSMAKKTTTSKEAVKNSSSSVKEKKEEKKLTPKSSSTSKKTNSTSKSATKVEKKETKKEVKADKKEIKKETKKESKAEKKVAISSEEEVSIWNAVSAMPEHHELLKQEFKPVDSRLPKAFHKYQELNGRIYLSNPKTYGNLPDLLSLQKKGYNAFITFISHVWFHG